MQREKEALQREKEARINEQQQQDFCHPLRRDLEEELDKDPTSEFLRDYVKNIYKGRPATCSGPSKDITLVSCEGLEERLQNAENPEIMLLIDKPWFEGRPQYFTTKFIKELSDNPKAVLDVQELDYSTSINSAIQMEAGMIVQRWEESGGKITSKPLNLLNISHRMDGLVPPGLAKHCTLLSEA